jgi:HTH-type transcriptional regulator/antitoxin HipB
MEKEIAPMDQITRTSPQLGAALRRRRKQAGLSQEALADKVKLRQATISRLENGDTGTELGTLLTVVAALDLEIVVRPRSKGRLADIENIF